MKTSGIAAVVIGRNEGERLVRCLNSFKGKVDRIVYVDSGSSDDSVEKARHLGADAVLLDLDKPFTAARARNAGVERLREQGTPEYVQFVDGDCEIDPDWLSTAHAFLAGNAKAAVACGRRRERFPDASIYNRLCDREWNTPIGKTKACGGDSLMRMTAFDQVGGFNPTLIAGEEPELCVRLRAEGWEIWRLDAEMTLHDAAMTRFGQWWKRSRRSGHASAEGMALHGAPPERHGVSTVVRALAWGLVLPLAIVLAALFVSPWMLGLVVIYPAQIVRLALRAGGSRGDWEEALFFVLGKFPELAGIMDYWRGRLVSRPTRLIEYK